MHWMDLDIILPIIHRSLTADGRLLVWRNVFGDAAAEVTPFRLEIERIVQRRGIPRAGRPEDADATVKKITDSGLFTIERLRHYRWTIDLTTEQVRALFGTFSDWTPKEVDRAASAVDARGGAVSESYTSWLIAASPSP